MNFLQSAKLIGLLVLSLVFVNLILLDRNLDLDVVRTYDKQGENQEFRLGSYQALQIYEKYKTPKYRRLLARFDYQFEQLAVSANRLVSNVVEINEDDYVDIVIEPGLRREQVAELLVQQLNWNSSDQARYARTEPMCYVNGLVLFQMPGTYRLHKQASPVEVEMVMAAQFNLYLKDLVAVNEISPVMLESALRIASLLQREAAGNGDERIIAGIIWNRLADEMSLDLDATLQYVKGQPGNWWPIVRPDDKYLDSPYNTYQNVGLPPGPIASSDLDMVIAALNPEPTECYFYLHADDRSFYCARDYEEHKRNIRRYL